MVTRFRLMKITETELPGLLLINPRIFEDSRGYFYESYNYRNFRENGLDYNFVQDNQSRSPRNVIRGLHYQLTPFAQNKLLRVTEGAVFDVVVDLRKNSPSYGKWWGHEISAENKLQLFIPGGFAHGFAVISEWATVLYKTDEFYNPQYERGINYADKSLGIEWRVEPGTEIVSAKDMNAPVLSEADNNFIYNNK